MKILVAPLNWGLGHASRCIPLIHRFLDEGHEVILGGDGDSLTLLRRHFPSLRYVCLAPLQLRYSRRSRQVWPMLRALPRLIAWAVKDHLMLRALLHEERIDRVVSDNRFGLYNRSAECIYITHQLHIFLPKGWRWAEGIASHLHAHIYARYDKVLVPDYEDFHHSLAGELSHPTFTFDHSPFTFIGPLSRFANTNLSLQSTPPYDVVAVLSGLEPQRTMLEQDLRKRFADTQEKVLIIQGLVGRPNTRIRQANITIVPSMSDSELVAALLNAKRIIARSGYSTIMDLHALDLLGRTEMIPTPGQPEQEYLAEFYRKCCTDKKKAVTLQSEIER